MQYISPIPRTSANALSHYICSGHHVAADADRMAAFDIAGITGSAASSILDKQTSEQNVPSLY